jgi:hypothetical protein
MWASIVDSASGMIPGSVGSGGDMEVAAAGNTEVVHAKLKTMRTLKLKDVIEDMLIAFDLLTDSSTTSSFRLGVT